VSELPAPAVSHPPMECRTHLAEVYTARNGHELAARYDAWAGEYDRELKLAGYCGPDRGARLLARYVAPSARILDAGAGTGLVGEALHRLGYRKLAGVDISAGMLAVARRKRVYRSLEQSDLHRALGFPDAWFDAAIAIGVFTYGHATASSIHELVRVTSPGGYLVFSMRPDFFESGDFPTALNALERSGRCRLVTRSVAFRVFTNSDAADRLQLWVYRLAEPESLPGDIR
jgi:predicted TPR repeat methyltransferase